MFPQEGGASHFSTFEHGEQIAVGLTYPYPGEGESVVIESVSPRVVENTAGATFEFVVCTLNRPGPEVLAIGLAGKEGFAEACPRPRPAVPGSVLDTGSPEPVQLVMLMTPRKPGSLKVDGADLSYEHGWQHGTQRVGGEYVRLKID